VTFDVRRVNGLVSLEASNLSPKPESLNPQTQTTAPKHQTFVTPGVEGTLWFEVEVVPY